MGAKERKGPVALSGQRWGILNTFSRKGRSPPALLFFPLAPGRAGFPVPRKARAGSRSGEELRFAGRALGTCFGLICSRPLVTFFLHNFYRQLKEKTPVSHRRLGVRRAKPQPGRVLPKTTHPPALLRVTVVQQRPQSIPRDALPC